jgi:hypothetical protein
VNPALAHLIDLLAAAVLDSLEAEGAAEEAPPPEDPEQRVPVASSGDRADRDPQHHGRRDNEGTT